MIEVPGYETFTKIEQINKGYSGDKKYNVATADGKRLLLRVADISEYDRKKAEFEMMKRIASLNVPMPQPVDFGICHDGKNIYQLLTWCDGINAETVLPRMSEAEQFALGMQAGQILQKIHTISAPESQEKWAVLFKQRTQSRFHKYHKSGLPFSDEEKIVKYIEQNNNLIEGRPQCLRHNDYHNGNMMVSNKKLIIIDFNDCDYGDPWEEFIFTVWNAQYYHHFSVGQICGYFEGEPPAEFWQLLAYYTISFLPTYISWGTIFGDAEIDKRIKQRSSFSMCV